MSIENDFDKEFERLKKKAKEGKKDLCDNLGIEVYDVDEEDEE